MDRPTNRATTLLDLFMREHAGVHSSAVADYRFNCNYILDGLTDEQLRARPNGLNSLIWIVWHLARVEDAFCGCLLTGREQVLTRDDFNARMGIDRLDEGEGMTKAEVAALSDAIDIAAVRAYRDAVGTHTREVARALWESGWHDPINEADAQRLADARVIKPEAVAELVGFLGGEPREMGLNWWGVGHNVYHLGQAGVIRTALART